MCGCVGLCDVFVCRYLYSVCASEYVCAGRLMHVCLRACRHSCIYSCNIYTIVCETNLNSLLAVLKFNFKLATLYDLMCIYDPSL